MRSLAEVTRIANDMVELVGHASAGQDRHAFYTGNDLGLEEGLTSALTVSSSPQQ